MANANSIETSGARSGAVALSSCAGNFSQVDLQKALQQCTLFIGRSYNFDEKHALQVTMLALAIYDATTSLHDLSFKDREILAVAAMLHDIGSYISYRRHHKNSCNLIMKAEIPQLSREDTLLAALVARYHRKSEPKPHHEFYTHLSGVDQERVTKLAAIIRIADALDHDHQQQARYLTIAITETDLVLTLNGSSEAVFDHFAVDKKSRLFKEVFGLQVKIS